MSSAILKCSNVSASFGGIRALSNIDLTVERGEIVGISGPNGAGKTTLFNVISGHVALQQGAIVFEDQPLAGLPPDRIFRLGLARTFQLPELVETQSVESNVLIGAHFAHDRGLATALGIDRRTIDAVEEALDLFGLTAVRGKPTWLASLFERKLIMLASAFASKPKLLLMDEPAGGLTDQEIDALMRHIRKIGVGGVTILVIEHVMRVLMDLSSRVVVLNQGSVLAEGLPDTIKLNSDVQRLYFGEALTP